MTTVREMYEALEGMLETNGGDEVFLASQPNWPMQNHVAGVELVEFVEDHPFEFNGDYPMDTAECAVCGQNAEHDDHQMVTRVYMVEGSQCEDSPYLPGEAKEALGW